MSVKRLVCAVSLLLATTGPAWAQAGAGDTTGDDEGAEGAEGTEGTEGAEGTDDTVDTSNASGAEEVTVSVEGDDTGGAVEETTIEVAGGNEAGDDVPPHKGIVLNGMASEGLSADTHGVHRGRAGIMYEFGRFAVDAQAQFEGWARWKPQQRGISALGIGLGAGLRVAITGQRYRGLYASLGATYLRLVGSPAEKINATNFELDPNVFVVRAGLGYGFKAANTTTVAFRIDVNKSFITIMHPIPERPDPAENPLSVHLGLEFIYWAP